MQRGAHAPYIYLLLFDTCPASVVCSDTAQGYSDVNSAKTRWLVPFANRTPPLIPKYRPSLTRAIHMTVHKGWIYTDIYYIHCTKSVFGWREGSHSSVCVYVRGDLRDLQHVGCNRVEQNGDELPVRKLSVNISANRENLCSSTGVDRRHSQHAGGVVAVNRTPRGLIFVSTNSSSAINRIYILYCFVDAWYCVT